MSPSELREALSGLGKAAIKFELSEMHDAAEVRHLCCRLAQVQSPVGFWNAPMIWIGSMCWMQCQYKTFPGSPPLHIGSAVSISAQPCLQCM